MSKQKKLESRVRRLREALPELGLSEEEAKKHVAIYMALKAMESPPPNPAREKEDPNAFPWAKQGLPKEMRLALTEFVKFGNDIYPASRIRHARIDVFNKELTVKVTVEGDVMTYSREHYLRGQEAVDFVMRVCPQALEGQRLSWVRHMWAVHNLVGHPVLQILSWAGLTRLGLFVHDVTVPNPKT